MNKGLELIADKEIDLEAINDGKFVEAYHEFISLQYLVNGDLLSFEQNVIENLIPALKIDINFSDLGYYYGKLGNVYLELGKYKKSAIMLDKAQKATRQFMILT
ncbi:hypothetical protein [Indiicoccus explosivorum]|uniref:hypothetical protein n=1 Tax=Indiicoccus explosivorum TaxID=1917864 RepID=UPI000B450D88|nr:hypothetical protein [Indiicoccus explosivorum]